jgi:hypothetical protein
VLFFYPFSNGQLRNNEKTPEDALRRAPVEICKRYRRLGFV